MEPTIWPSVARRPLLALIVKLALAIATGVAMAGRSRLSIGGPGRREGYADSNGVRLYFVQEGEGQLMLFLHGFPDSWRLYESQLVEFGRDRTVVAPNLRGFPPSDAPELVQAYSMARSLDDVHALLRHFGHDRCILVGNDWGGYIAWVFASAYPDRVERLIILNAPHPAIFLREIRNNAAQIQASQYERNFRTSAPPYPPWYNYYRADPIKVPLSVSDAAQTEMPDIAATFFNGVAETPANTSLRVEAQTLIIWGMQDPYTLPGQLENIDAYVPNATIVRIEDGGHRPMLSHPTLVNAAIRDFLLRSNH
jgi:epoxide hydrolase 4